MSAVKFADNYNLDCVAIDEKTGLKLFSFKAREFSEKENSASFVSGGIASGSQKYQIKTNEKRVKLLRPYADLVIVEDIRYVLTFVKTRKPDLPFAYDWQRGKNKEYILELQ